jgi:hypothetical protein
MGIRKYKWAKIRITTGTAESILRGDFDGISCELPLDFQVVGVQQPEYSVGDYFYLIVQSGEFNALRANETIPEIPTMEFTVQ